MGAAYWLRRGGNLLLSSLFEGGEEIGQSLISNHALGEENDWGRLLYEGAVGVGVGPVFGGGGTALDTAMGRYREHRAEAGAARESARIGAVMDEAVKAAEASRVRERSPEAFDDFVEYVGGQGQEKVNVDGARQVGRARPLGKADRHPHGHPDGAGEGETVNGGGGDKIIAGGMIMKETRQRLITLAARCMFDIEGTAARRYMDRLAHAAHRRGVRDVSPEGAFVAAGRALCAGIAGVEKKYPELLSGASQTIQR